jgi:hypothetical protein
LKNFKNGDKQRKYFYKKRKGCCKGIAKFDAEDYFKQKIMKKCLQIKEKEDLRRRVNSGFGFVSFISNLQVKTCLNKSYFKKLIQKSLTPSELERTKALSWRIK